MEYKEKSSKILTEVFKLENRIKKLVEELYDVNVNHSIKADFQQQLYFDNKNFEEVLQQLEDTDNIDTIKLIEERATELATNIKLLELGNGSFNILMLPHLLSSRTKRKVENRDVSIHKLKALFQIALNNQAIRTEKVEAKWPGINKKNGLVFNVELHKSVQPFLNAINKLT